MFILVREIGRKLAEWDRERAKEKRHCIKIGRV